MDATVIVCTYNRCQSLQFVLADLASQCIRSAIEWQVLVVDNNSKDDTKSVVEDYARRYPRRFSYAFESKQGKCHALNAGVRLASGDVLAFTDDDVRLDPNWLESLLSAFDDPDVLGAGGRIKPAWESNQPAWLPTDYRLLRGPLVLFDHGDAPTTLAEAPFGANMAFRKEAFRRFGAFNVELGPRPGSELRGEDSEFCDRLLRAASIIRYQPGALVYHPVPVQRLSKQFFLNWWFDKGRSDIVVETDFGGSAPPLARLILGAVKLTVHWLACGPPVMRFERKLLVWYRMGAIAELWNRRRLAA